jgi:hypothetical protein
MATKQPALTWSAECLAIAVTILGWAWSARSGGVLIPWGPLAGLTTAKGQRACLPPSPASCPAFPCPLLLCRGTSNRDMT